MRTVKTEFPEIAIPQEVLELVAQGRLTDTSWHNDAGPSFAAGQRTLWVHAEGSLTEYFVTQGDDLLVETDELVIALEAAGIHGKPKCQICDAKDAVIDGATKAGPWAYMCETCHGVHGRGLGLGRGQALKGIA